MNGPLGNRDPIDDATPSRTTSASVLLATSLLRVDKTSARLLGAAGLMTKFRLYSN